MGRLEVSWGAVSLIILGSPWGVNRAGNHSSGFLWVTIIRRSELA